MFGLIRRELLDACDGLLGNFELLIGWHDEYFYPAARGLNFEWFLRAAVVF